MLAADVFVLAAGMGAAGPRPKLPGRGTQPQTGVAYQEIYSGHVSTLMFHAGNIAWRTGKKLRLDARTETFDDKEANHDKNVDKMSTSSRCWITCSRKGRI